MPSYFAVSLDPKSFWERLEPIDLVDTAVLGWPLEDVRLFLCLHGFKHGWERVGWIGDVAELLHVHQRMDWGGVLIKAEASGSGRILWLGLLLADDLLGAALPAGIAQRLQTDAAVTRFGAQLFRKADSSPKVFETLLSRLRGRERLRDKLRYGVHRPTTLTAGDCPLLRLPDVLFPLHYLLRPIWL